MVTLAIPLIRCCSSLLVMETISMISRMLRMWHMVMYAQSVLLPLKRPQRKQQDRYHFLICNALCLF